MADVARTCSVGQLTGWQPLALVGMLGFAACGGADKPANASAHDSAQAESAETSPDCAAWLTAEPVPDGETTCAQPRPDAVTRIQESGARYLPLSSGHHAVVWLPDGWTARSSPSLLVLLHGSTGCAEASLADFQTMLGEEHALLSLNYTLPDGSFAEAAGVQQSLDEAMAALEAACPTPDTTYLLYGISRGGARAIALAGLDRAGAQRFSGVVSDSGTLPGRQLDGISYGGARLLLWCGEYDPDPVQEGRTTCEVMQDDLAPLLQSRGATVDAVEVGREACHGMQQWDCTPDCATCSGMASPGDAGPHVETVSTWLSQVASGG